MCVHCQQSHVAGHIECRKQQQETLICQIQQREKICRLRVVQMAEDKTEISQIQTSRFAMHFTCTKREGRGERKMTPWLLEKCIQQQIDKRPLKIQTSGKNSYLIQVDSEEQCKKSNEH